MTNKKLDELFADSPEILSILKEVHAREASLEKSSNKEILLYEDIEKEKLVTSYDKSSEGITLLSEESHTSIEKSKQPEKPDSPKTKKDSVGKKIINNILYFSMLITILMSIMAYKQKENADFSIFGFHIYNVLTDSMKSEIPPGSFVLVKEVDKSTIQIGDDITFYASKQKSITHRVVEVMQDYEGYGLAFRTKGLDNNEPDKDVVFAENVVGKVKIHIPYLGFIMRFIGENIFTLGGLFAGFLIFLWILKRFIYLSKQEKLQKKKYVEHSDKTADFAELKRVKRGKYSSHRLL